MFMEHDLKKTKKQKNIIRQYILSHFELTKEADFGWQPYFNPVYITKKIMALPLS
jgi:hypothetical protein